MTTPLGRDIIPFSEPILVPMEFSGYFELDGIAFDFYAEVWPLGQAQASRHQTFPVTQMGPYEASWRVVSRATGAISYPSEPPSLDRP